MKWVLIGLTLFAALLAALLLIRDKTPRFFKKQLDQVSESLDVSWIVLALGLVGAGTKCIQNTLGSVPLVLLGVVFIILAALCIGRATGKGLGDIINSNSKVGLGLGIIIIVTGIIICVITWKSILEKPLTNIPLPLVFLGWGIIAVVFSLRRKPARVVEPSKVH
jgi:hypothetical protein